MAYVGNVPAAAYTNTVKDTFSGNGSTVAFTLSRPSLTNDVRVVVENVIQDPTVAYSVSGTTLTFTSAPPSGTNNIYVVHLGPAIQTAVPPSEISTATTFASNVTVQGAFTSRGIDDNADAVAMTIDSSENVLVGKTSTSGDVVGHRLSPDGRLLSTVDGNYVAQFNRKTSDGNITEFRKDGSAVGSIGVDYSTRMYIGTGGAGVFFNSDVPALQPYSITSGDVVDNSITLGAAAVRWKDAYLSGGVYLGGTGAANYLDDYEEGTWTPTFVSDGSVSATYMVQSGRYVKIGKLVYAAFDLEANITAFSGSVGGVSALPFIPGGTLYYSGGPVFRSTTAVLLAAGQTLRGYVEVNSHINLQSMELDSGENAFVGLRTGTPRRLNGYVIYATA